MKILDKMIVCLSLILTSIFLKGEKTELPKLSLKTLSKSIQPRCLLTTSCRDTDLIPKCGDAGKMFTENGVSYQCMHNGIKILDGSYHSPWMNYIIQELEGHHEPQEELVFYEVLKSIAPGGTMLELGCAWSYYSMWFLKEGGASCYLLEPIKNCLEWGQKNFEFNEFPGTFIHGYVSDGSTKIFSDFVSYLDKKNIIPPAFSVDQIVKKYSIDKLSIVHADVQGAELSVLRGSQESIAKKIIDYFFISTHGNLHNACLKFLIEKEFHIVAEHSRSESTSADGLIVAEAPHVNRKLIVLVSKI